MTHEIIINQTAVAGAWSANTQKFTQNVYLRQIVVKANTATTGFHFYIQDSNSIFVFDTRTEGMAATGTLMREVNIPLLGIHTFGVVNADNNEAFTGKLVYSEKPKG